MDKFDKRATNRYYDDILNVEYRVGSQDRFSDSPIDRVETGKPEPAARLDDPRRHQ